MVTKVKQGIIADAAVGTAQLAGDSVTAGKIVDGAVGAAEIAEGAVGTAHGVGDGSTTFNVPDLRGRVAAGKDNMGGTAANRLTTAGSGVDGATLGAAGGAQTHTLTTAQMPAHTHSIGVSGSGGGNGVQSATTNDGSARTTGSQGSGQAHNNTQPTLVLNYVIKT